MRPHRPLLAALLALALLGAAAAPASAFEYDESQFANYAMEKASVSLSTNQAGAHADLTTSFGLTNDGGFPYAPTKKLEIHLPPGAIGNPQGIPPCTIAQLGLVPEDSECPIASQIGISEVTITEPNGSFTEPVYNMAPPKGQGDVIARFGLMAGPYPTFIDVGLDPTDYSIVATIEGISSAAGFVEAKTTIWGVPAAKSHNSLRLSPLDALQGKTSVPPVEAGLPEAPFLSNPTDCSLTRQLRVTATAYPLPNSPSTIAAPYPQITGCEALDFAPTFTTTATNPEAAAPTGLDATLKIPQDETPQGLATSTLRSASVALPEGFAINPAAGDGLQACSAAEVGFGRNEAAHCPEAAKIGSAEMKVPALEHTLGAAVYQRTPEPGHLFRFWLVADEQGVHLKLPAEIEADPLSGQLTTRFDGIAALGGNPQVPFEELRLHVFGGPRAPLATPEHCGTYQTSYSFSPWSGRAAAAGQTPIQITSGCGKGGFSPKLVAGTASLRAGAYSPFLFTLTRSDGEAEPRSIAIHLPQGLLAKLAGVPLCPEAQAGSGNCPAGSKIGSLTAATGVGGAPLWIPQPGKAPTAAYLAGPYKGAPYSVVTVVPAQVGPFDLGDVVTRAAIYVDPDTALATIRTDPLPQILEGVPVTYRTIHVTVDRPGFTLNPTSCAAKKITASVAATDGQSSEPSVPFQATNCAKLAYKPRLKLYFKGQTKRTGNPAISALLTQKPHQANTRAAITLLPAGEFIDNAHISTPCTRVQFDADRCPKRSILGHAKAWSPLLDKPLQGPVYFRSNGGARELPDLVADLNGPLHITLVGYIDSVKTGPESSRVRVRFLHVPDAPVTRFKLAFFGGRRGLIENSHNLCARARRARLTFKAQNGRVKTTNPPIRARCGKHRGHGKHPKHP